MTKEMKTFFLHSGVFAAATVIYLIVANLMNYRELWWVILPLAFLVSLGREWYSKIKYNDFGWDDIAYSMIGTCIILIGYAIAMGIFPPLSMLSTR